MSVPVAAFSRSSSPWPSNRATHRPPSTSASAPAPGYIRDTVTCGPCPWPTGSIRVRRPGCVVVSRGKLETHTEWPSVATWFDCTPTPTLFLRPIRWQTPVRSVIR